MNSYVYLNGACCAVPSFYKDNTIRPHDFYDSCHDWCTDSNHNGCLDIPVTDAVIIRPLQIISQTERLWIELTDTKISNNTTVSS